MADEIHPPMRRFGLVLQLARHRTDTSLSVLATTEARRSELWEWLRRALPEALMERCSLGGMTDGRQTLFAPNGAIALRIKHLLPGLRAACHAKFAEVSAITVVVQVRQPCFSARARSPLHRSIEGEGRVALQVLADQIGDGPVRQAIQTLLRNAAESGLGRPPAP
jgi:Dna[CI] antecedent, DciA